MSPEPAPAVQSSSRRRAWLAAALALAAFAVAVGISLRNQSPPARSLSLTGGPRGTTRELVARALAAELRERGIPVDVVPSEEIHREIADLDAGRIDLALVSGAVRAARPLRIRELTPLFQEALHLLVRQELAERVRGSLGELRELLVDLGPPDSPTSLLAAEILAFAGVACAPGAEPGGCRTSQLEIEELERRIGSADRAALPDAMFHLAAVPSLVALRLVREHGYELVPLPFAEAFRLDAIVAEEDAAPREVALARRFTRETVIPAYAYRIEPPVPPGPCPTVGSRLLLVAHETVPAETVERVLEVVFQSRFAHLPEPTLSTSLLDIPPRLLLHEGTRAFLARSQPFISSREVDKLANTLSVLGAVLAGGVFVWQSLRQRMQARRDEQFGKYQLRVAALERRLVELELAANLELEPLISLQRDLLELKSEALARFTAGELGDQATLADLLLPLDGARDHVGALLLHVRENIEAEAESEGRSVQAVWQEAAEGSEEPPTQS
jgi:TRAP-type uncharacterized transport system substrate-binding protein